MLKRLSCLTNPFSSFIFLGNDDEILNSAQSGHFYGNALNNFISSYKNIGTNGQNSNRKKNNDKDVSPLKEKPAKTETVNKPKSFRGHIKAKATADPYFLLSNSYQTRDQSYSNRDLSYTKPTQDRTFSYRTEFSSTSTTTPAPQTTRKVNHFDTTPSPAYLTVDKFNRRLSAEQKQYDFLIKLTQPNNAEKLVTTPNEFQRTKDNTYSQNIREQYTTRPSVELSTFRNTQTTETTTKASPSVRKINHNVSKKFFSPSTFKPFYHSYLEKTTVANDNEDDGSYRPEEYEKVCFVCLL